MKQFDILVAAIIRKDEKIIMVQEDNGDWNLPTGHVEPDEDLYEAIIREVKEETGYDVKVDKLHKIYQYFKDDKNKFRFTFNASILRGDIAERNIAEIKQVKAFSEEEIRSMPDRSFRNIYMKEMIFDKDDKKVIKVIR